MWWSRDQDIQDGKDRQDEKESGIRIPRIDRINRMVIFPSPGGEGRPWFLSDVEGKAGG